MDGIIFNHLGTEHVLGAPMTALDSCGKAKMVEVTMAVNFLHEFVRPFYALEWIVWLEIWE